jgi:hypothetical protein
VNSSPVHDFGSCTWWFTRVEESFGYKLPSVIRSAISIQPNGDLNTPCITADVKDIVIPGTAKSVPLLIELFGDVRNVMRSDKRPFLAYFSGGVRGFGALARTR